MGIVALLHCYIVALLKFEIVGTLCHCYIVTLLYCGFAATLHCGITLLSLRASASRKYIRRATCFQASNKFSSQYIFLFGATFVCSMNANTFSFESSTHILRNEKLPLWFCLPLNLCPVKNVEGQIS